MAVDTSTIIPKYNYRHRAQSIIQSKSLDLLEGEVAHGFYETTPPKNGSHKHVVAIEILYSYFWWNCLNSFSFFLYDHSPLSPWQQTSLIFAVVGLLALLLSVGGVRRVFSAPLGLMVARLLGLAALEAHQFSKPVLQVALAGIGGGACFLAVAGGLWDLSLLDKHRKIYFHLLGFVASRTPGLCFATPVYWRPFWCHLLVVLGMANVVATFTRDQRTPLVTKDDISILKSPAKKLTPALLEGKRVWAWLGVGFGCHLFVASSAFGREGILARWVELNDEFKSQLFLMLLIAVLCVAMLLGNEYNLDLICSTQWLFVGVASYLTFAFTSSFASALGGAVAILHIMSLWPQIYHRITESSPALILPVAMVTYVATLLASRITLGGVSSANVCIVVAMVAEWAGLRKWLPLGLQMGRVKRRSESTINVPQRRPSYILVLGHMIRRLSTVIEIDEEEDEVVEEGSIHEKRLLELLSSQEEEIKRFDLKKLKQAMVVLILVGVLGTLNNYNPWT